METKKNLIIGAFSNYNLNDVLAYLDSIQISTPTDTDKIMLVYNTSTETQQELRNRGWDVYVGELLGHIHMQRFRDMMYILSNLETEYNYIITTDVRDVVFQHNPFPWLDKNLIKPVLFASENLTYEEEPWGTKNIHEGYGDLYWNWIRTKEIANVGIIAGKGKEMIDLFRLIWLVSQAGNTTHFTDQSGANLIIHNKLIRDNIQIDPNFCLQVGTLKDKEHPNDYQKYPLIHQYDRSKLFTEIVKKM